MENKLQVLKEIAEHLNEETDQHNMLQGVIKTLIEKTNFDTAWIFLIDDSGKQRLAAHHNLPDQLTEGKCEHLTENTCWCMRRYNNNALHKATNIIMCSRLEIANKVSHLGSMDITHHATVSLTSGTEKFGVLNVASKYKKQYSDDELAFLDSVGLQIGSSIKRIQLTLKEQEHLIIKERQRLARDLHDSVNQMLFSISITSHAARSIAKDKESIEAFKSIENVSKHAMKEMKALIWQLKPIGLEDGLIHAIERYANLLGLKVSVELDGFYEVSDEIEMTIYRIIQESLNNVNKHAKTNKVCINIIQEDQEISVQIQDEGIGFEMSEVSNMSDGILNMKSRVHKLNGTINIQSNVNEGTLIQFSIPVKGEAHA